MQAGLDRVEFCLAHDALRTVSDDFKKPVLDFLWRQVPHRNQGCLHRLIIDASTLLRLLKLHAKSGELLAHTLNLRITFLEVTRRHISFNFTGGLLHPQLIVALLDFAFEFLHLGGRDQFSTRGAICDFRADFLRRRWCHKRVKCRHTQIRHAVEFVAIPIGYRHVALCRSLPHLKLTVDP
jgi:hypothetical protein